MPPIKRSIKRQQNLANNLSGMRIFEGRYFNINRKLLRCLGLWPYQKKVTKYVLRAIIFSLAMLFMVPQLISLKLHYKNTDRLMLNLLMVLSTSVITLMVIGMVVSEKNMIKLFKCIANNWDQIQDQGERNVLHKYSERARTITIFYRNTVVTFFVIGITFTLIPKFLDAVNPLENRRPEIDLLGGEYFIDGKSHFMLLFCVQYLPVVMGVVIAIAVDTTYIVTVEHCCMLFEIVRYRLVKLKRIVQESSSSDEDVDSYEWLRRTIQLHQEALAFTEILKDSYTAGFLFMLIVALAACPLNCCAIIANLDKPLHLVPYVLYYVSIMIRGFCLFYPGQRVIDHQLNLCDAAYYNKWYVTPRRTRKLLLTFTIRCTQPTIVSAGGLLPINFEVYFMMLKTTLSYVTAVWSFR